MEKITYITCFGGLGYYATYQPNYEWSFTNDIQKALEYKSLKGAIDRLFAMGLDSTHEYAGTNRTLVEKTTIITLNGTTMNTSSTTKVLSFDECATIYKKFEDDKFKKRVDKFNRETERTSVVNEQERIKWEKIITKRKEKQDEFFHPKCADIQQLLNTPDYVEKRRKFLSTIHDEISFTSFYEANYNNNDSKYYILYKLFNTMKILLDNKQSFVLSDNKILIENTMLENTRSIFMNNGVFKTDYCHFEREDLFKY